MNILTYKGYDGCFEYDAEADIFHGEVRHINDVVTFQGRSIDELKQALADSVEDYLAFCAEEGRQPQKPFSGRQEKERRRIMRQRSGPPRVPDSSPVNARS